MKTDLPAHGSGKTKFKKLCGTGQSWTKLRDEAIKAGTWRPLPDAKPKKRK